jgi:hypothetical protein
MKIQRPTYLTWNGRLFMEMQFSGMEEAEIPDDLLTMDGLRALPTEAPQEPGVYFLWLGDLLIYIGSTTDDLLNRINDHRRTRMGLREGPRYNYTHATVMPHDAKTVRQQEYRYIDAYRPPFNPQIAHTGWGLKARVEEAYSPDKSGAQS